MVLILGDNIFHGENFLSKLEIAKTNLKKNKATVFGVTVNNPSDFGVIQYIVKWVAKIMQISMKTSGAETLSISANVFVGQTEAPILIRPFINNMTKSELMAVMTGGFATAAGSVLALYILWLKSIPGIAGHLLAASIMSAPAALVMAKIIYPETEHSDTFGEIELPQNKRTENAMDALSLIHI